MAEIISHVVEVRELLNMNVGLCWIIIYYWENINKQLKVPVNSYLHLKEI